MNEQIRQKLEGRYSVLLQAEECPICHSIQAAMIMDMAGGRPAVMAICLMCGHEHMLPRFKPECVDTERMAEWARAVKAVDGQRCHICGRPADLYPLDAHHIIPRSHDKNGRYWYSLSNGIALCKNCHELVHGEWMKKYRRADNG